MDSELKLDISCPVCLEIYKDPVILSCSHSFCKACLQQFWQSKQPNACPVCKRRSSKDSFLPNQALKAICETLSETFLQEKEGTLKMCKEPNRKLECHDEEQPGCLDSKETAAAFDSKTTEDQETEAQAVQRESGESNMEEAHTKASKLIDQLNNITLDIAVTGVTGAGKSSFVNAIRGVDDADKDAAPTGVTETTMEPAEYPHPTMPNVKIWDLPGTGSPTFTAAKYIKDVDFERYDFFLILTFGRIREDDINLAIEVRKKKKNFYFIRTKIDQDVRAEARKGKSEQETLKLIRDDCEQKLKALESPCIFLVSSHELEKFEFSDLVEALMKDLPANKRDALIQSLPVYSMEILKKKYKRFKNITWAVAAASGAIAAAPVPGLSLAADTSMIFAFFTKVYFSFGLDDKSLEKLSEKVNKPIQVEIKKIPLIKALAEKSVQGVLTMLTLIIVSEGIETALSFVPIVGTVAAAGLSFVTTLSALRQGLKVLYDAAKEMIQMAGLN